MRGKSQFRTSLLCTPSLAAAVALLVLLAAVPAWAQNPVPPTAREAAASPAFAAKLPILRRPARQGAGFGTRPRQFGNGSASCATDLRRRIRCVYDNGPVNGTTDAWTINFGYVVSDTFPGGSGVSGFDIYVWEFPGDVVTSLQWSITSRAKRRNPLWLGHGQ